MIGIFGGRRMAEIERKTAELEMRLDAISGQLAATTDRLAVVNDELAMAIEELAARAAAMADAQRQADALAGVMTAQAAAIVRLDEGEARHLELDRRIWGNMARLERQAAIDVAELRQTSMALAERLLRQGVAGATVAKE